MCLFLMLFTRVSVRWSVGLYTVTLAVYIYVFMKPTANEKPSSFGVFLPPFMSEPVAILFLQICPYILGPSIHVKTQVSFQFDIHQVQTSFKNNIWSIYQ